MSAPTLAVPAEGALDRSVRRMTELRWLPWLLLAVSVAGSLLVMAGAKDGFAAVDLRVYVQAPTHLADGRLYTFVADGSAVDRGLPFTYPAFAAMLFWPLAQLPWPVVVTGWLVLDVVLLVVCCYLGLRLVNRAGPAAGRRMTHPVRAAVLLSAVALWCEPVRSTVNYGQINLVLMALLLGGAVAVREWWPGVTVGLAAGVKLVPAITLGYYLLARRWRPVAAALVAGLFTVLVGLAVAGRPAWTFFTSLMFDPSRTGRIDQVRNQSLRGAAADLVGSRSMPVWAALAVLTVALGGWAARRALRGGDRAAAFLCVQFVGLEISPVSWNHHWVWVVPLLLWCLFAAPRRPGRWLGLAWLIAVFSFALPIAAAKENAALVAGRAEPWWTDALHLLYPALGLATLVVVLVIHRPPLPPAGAPGGPGPAGRTR